jgi:hypothetical protein
MDRLERNDSYRQLHIWVNQHEPGVDCSYAVSARSSRRGVHRDRLLLRGRVDLDIGRGDVPMTLRELARVIAQAADNWQAPPA